MINRWLQCIRTTCAIAWARPFNIFIIIYQQQSIASMDAFDIVAVFYLKLAPCMRKASDANGLASKRAARQSRVRKSHGPTPNKLYKYLNKVRLLALLIHCVGDNTRIRTWKARDASIGEARICICRNPKRNSFTNYLSRTACEYLALKITVQPHECNYTHFVHWLTVPNSTSVVFCFSAFATTFKTVLKLHCACAHCMQPFGQCM